MVQVKQGDTIRVHYTVSLRDGTIIGSTTNHEPLQFNIGEGRVLQDFEEAVVGMNTGESKNIQIPADKAFSPHYEEMVVVIDRKQFPHPMPYLA